MVFQRHELGDVPNCAVLKSYKVFQWEGPIKIYQANMSHFVYNNFDGLVDAGGFFLGALGPFEKITTHVFPMGPWERVAKTRQTTGYPLVNCHITVENHHAINGKTHYFNGHFQ